MRSAWVLILMSAACSGPKSAAVVACEKTCTNGKCSEASGGSIACFCGASRCDQGCTANGEECATAAVVPVAVCADLSCAADQKCVENSLAGATCQLKECSDVTCTATQRCVAAGGGVAAHCVEKVCADLSCLSGEICVTDPAARCVKSCSLITCDGGFYCVPSTETAPECQALPGVGGCACPAGQYCRQDLAGAAKSCVQCPTEVEPNDAITGGPPDGYRYSEQRLFKPEQATRIGVCGVFKADTPINDGTHDCVQPDAATTTATGTCPVGTSLQACNGTGGFYPPMRLPASSSYTCFAGGGSVSTPYGGALADNPGDAYALVDQDTFLTQCLPGYRYSAKFTALDAGASLTQVRILEARDTVDGLAQIVTPGVLGDSHLFLCPPSGQAAISARANAGQAGKRLLLEVQPDSTYSLCDATPGPRRTCSTPGEQCAETPFDLDSNGGSVCVTSLLGPPAAAPSPHSDPGCTSRFVTHGLMSAECFAGNGTPVRGAKGCLCGTGTAANAASEAAACDRSGIPQIAWSGTSGYNTAQFGPTFAADTWMSWWRVPCIAGRTIRINVSQWNNSTLQPAITVIGNGARQSWSTCLDDTLTGATGTVQLDYTCDAMLAGTTPASTVVSPSAYDVYVAVHATNPASPGTPHATDRFDYAISTTVLAQGTPAAKNYVDRLVRDEYRTSSFCKDLSGAAFKLSQLYTCR